MGNHKISVGNLVTWMLTALMAGVCLLVFYFIIFPGQGYFQSDCTDTIYWAEAVCDSGRLISDSFKYSALLPFGGSLIMLPFISLFGVSMTTHIIGMVIFAGLFIAALFFLFRSMKFNYNWSMAAVIITLMTLSSSEKLREIFWGHIIYYSLGLLFLFVGLNLVCKLTAMSGLCENSKIKKTYLLLFFMFAFTELTALNGVSTLVMYTFPLLFAVIAERFFDSTVKFLSNRNIIQGIIVIIIVFATVCGLVSLKLIKGNIVAGYAEGYSHYAAMSSWDSNLMKFIPQWFSLLGVNISESDPLASVKSVLNIIRILGGAVLLAAPAAMLFQYKKIRDRNLKLLLWSHIGVSAFILYAFIFGCLSGANWRLSPLVGSSVVVCVAYAKWLWDKRGFGIRQSIIVLTAIMLPCLISAGSILSMPSDYGRENDLHKLTQVLEENNLDYGYATFWYSQSITVISDSKVKVRNVTIDDSGYSPYYYQSQYSWFNDQKDQEHYFLLLNEMEYNILDNTDKWDELARMKTGEIISDEYHILIFDENIF